MRRISVKHARAGMILRRPVYDGQGFEVVEAGTEITTDLLDTLAEQGVSELIVEDWRVADVPVVTLISPELEGRAVQSLKALLTESQGSSSVDKALIADVETPTMQMTQSLFPEVAGEINAGGCRRIEDYPFLQPVRVAGLALLMGRRLGMDMTDLASLGMAAMLKDVGAVAMPEDILLKAGPSDAETEVIQRHPMYGAKIAQTYEHLGQSVVMGIAFHHERWDGSGYPKRLKGEQLPLSARILAIADSYYDLVSTRPGKPGIMPHEAVEFVMAYTGDLFDPELVELFARQVPPYPTGITVKLNSGEVGIVSNSNLGYVGRPVVRICYDEKGRELKDPYDVDLAGTGNQGRMISYVMEY